MGRYGWAMFRRGWQGPRSSGPQVAVGMRVCVCWVSVLKHIIIDGWKKTDEGQYRIEAREMQQTLDAEGQRRQG